jgi:hypothetical protein
MKTAIICASIASLFAIAASAQNENVTWLTPKTIASPLDVSTTGLYYGSWAPHGSTLAVNGVTFQAFSDLPGLSSTFDNSTGPGSFASPNPTTGDANYDSLMTSGAFGNNNQSYSFSWGGMTAGDTYQVQLWVNDGRNSTVNQRTETVTGGANTSAFLDYGFGDNGPGQYIIGTFVADNSGQETLTLNPGSAFPSPQLNLFQVRDITVVPEPSTLAFLGTGAVALFAAIRRRK